MIDRYASDPTEDADAYLTAHPFPKTDWRRFAPTHKSLPADATWEERSIARFGLAQPFPEEHSVATWKKYYKERSRLRGLQDPRDPKNDPQEYECGPYHDAIRSYPHETLLNLVPDGDTSALADRLSDGILVVQFSGMGNSD
jgi:hypothetical protein